MLSYQNWACKGYGFGVATEMCTAKALVKSLSCTDHATKYILRSGDSLPICCITSLPRGVIAFQGGSQSLEFAYLMPALPASSGPGVSLVLWRAPSWLLSWRSYVRSHHSPGRDWRLILAVMSADSFHSSHTSPCEAQFVSAVSGVAPIDMAQQVCHMTLFTVTQCWEKHTASVEGG